MISQGFSEHVSHRVDALLTAIGTRNFLISGELHGDIYLLFSIVLREIDSVPLDVFKILRCENVAWTQYFCFMDVLTTQFSI